MGPDSRNHRLQPHQVRPGEVRVDTEPRTPPTTTRPSSASSPRLQEKLFLFSGYANTNNTTERAGVEEERGGYPAPPIDGTVTVYTRAAGFGHGEIPQTPPAW